MWRNTSSFFQFLRNASASCQNRHMGIDFGSRCEVGCVFCFNNNDLPGVIQRIPLINEDEFELAINIARPYVCSNIIQIGAGDKIWWGDPMAHPKFISFIRRIAKTYPDAEIHFDTSGFYATNEIIDGLKELKNVRMFLSVNTFDNQVRSEYLRNSNAEGLLLMLKELPIHYTFIKYFGHAGLLISDAERLILNKNVQHICVYKLHYTRFNEAAIVEKLKFILSSFYPAVETLYQEFPPHHFRTECQWLHHPIDQMSPLFRDHSKFLERIIGEIQEKVSSGNFILFTGESAFEYLALRIGKDHVIKVRNSAYGGSITSTGMLVLEDIISALCETGIRSGWTYVIPSEIIDERGFDRINVPLSTLRKKLDESGAILKDLKMLTYVY